MRRRIFYLSVALLAFGISSFVGLKFYFKHTENYAIDQTMKTTKSEVEEQPSKLVQETSQEEEPNEEEKAAFDVLKPTIAKWLRGEKIKHEFTDASNESIKEVSGKDKSELSKDQATWFSYFKFEPTLIDVDGDGKNELAIRNNCSIVGNCQFWLFKKKGNDYQIILKTLPGAVQTFKLKIAKTNGYFDLETKDHGTASSGEIEIYKFDGEKYKMRECYNYDSSNLKDGKLYELKKTKITTINCN